MRYVVKEKVVEIEENKQEERISRIRKKVVGYVYAVVGNNKFLVKFEVV